MKKFLIFFCLALMCSSLTTNYAQSRRVSPNRKPAQNETKPQPTPPVSQTTAQTIDEAVEADDSEIIKVDTQIVSVPVKVLDRSGRFIGGLKKENFKVFEDGVDQEIASFGNEEQPFTVALALDMSYSAKFKAEEIQNAALAFIGQLRPEDKVMVISFDSEVYVQCEPTNDRKVLRAAIRRTRISYGTSLYDAMDLVINNRLKRIAGRKAIVLFSDGVDTSSSQANDFNNLSDALELDALIYPIEYDTFNEVQAMRRGSVIIQPGKPPEITGTMNDKGTTAAEYEKASEYLNQLADRTGGRLYKATTLANLSSAFSRIASELREYYSLGYYPTDESKAGKNHKIKVKVDRPGTIVKTRDTYILRRKDKK